MKPDQMPDRIAILTPQDMEHTDYSRFWITQRCPGGEHVARDCGSDYVEYVRADLMPDQPRVPPLKGKMPALAMDPYSWDRWLPFPQEDD